jgi:hypothetical protein
MIFVAFPSNMGGGIYNNFRSSNQEQIAPLFSKSETTCCI